MDKLKFTVDLDDFDCFDCGNGAKSFADDIMNRIAVNMLNRYNNENGDIEAVLRERTDILLDRFESQLEDRLVSMLKKEYLSKVSENVTCKLEGLYEKSKAFREAKQGLDIEQDRMISSGLRTMVKDVVAEEVRKMIRVQVININKDDLQFLIDLQRKLKTQDNDCQAEPRFLVVGENIREWEIDPGYADGCAIVDCVEGDELGESVAEALESIKGYGVIDDEDDDSLQTSDFAECDGLEDVTKVSDGSVVNECFVLRPDKDSAARKALITYARETSNTQLSKDIYKWLGYDYTKISNLTVYQNDAIMMEYDSRNLTPVELKSIYDNIQTLHPYSKIIAVPMNVNVHRAGKSVINNTICALEEILAEMNE